MPNVLFCGSLTRDYMAWGPIGQGGRRWTQAGGAPWHGALALAALAQSASPLEGASRAEEDTVRLDLMATAGPWARRYALPGMAGFGIRWRGPATDRDTVFRNHYGRGRYDSGPTGMARRQRLGATARRLEVSDMPPGQVDAAIVSPLHRDDVSPDVIVEFRRRGAFVALDVQGLMRTAGDDGWLGLSVPRDGSMLAAADVVKFSAREFEAFAGRGDSRRLVGEVAQDLDADVLLTRGSDGVVLASAGTVVEVPAEAGVASAAVDADVTGAGDVLLAVYVAARLGGRGPADAVEMASVETGALLRRRVVDNRLAGGRLGGNDAAALVTELRRLHACALALERLEGAGVGASAEIFGATSALVQAINAHLAEPVIDAEFAGRAAVRAARLLSGCWALWSTGWPRTSSLSASALRGAMDGEVAGVRALHGW